MSKPKNVCLFVCFTDYSIWNKIESKLKWGKKFTLKLDGTWESLIWTLASKIKMTCLKQYEWLWLVGYLVTIFHKLELAPSLWLGIACKLRPHEISPVTGCQLGNPFPGPPMKISHVSSADFLLLSGEYVTTEGEYTNKTNPLSLSTPGKPPLSSKEFFLPLNSFHLHHIYLTITFCTVAAFTLPYLLI